MISLETTQNVPLKVWEDGSIRLAGSRVTLDSIVFQYKSGVTVEQIADSFPPLKLSDIYAAIAYYLSHQLEVDDHIGKRIAEARTNRRKIKSNSDYQKQTSAIRERLVSRQPKTIT